MQEDSQNPTGTSQGKQELSSFDVREVRRLLEILNEKRRAGRWNLGFRITKYAIFIAIASTIILAISRFSGDVWDQSSVTYGANTSGSDEGHIAKIRVDDVIYDNSDASSGMIVAGLTAAYNDPNTKAVLLEINSPGGSPVHSGQIYDEIIRLREERPNIKVISLIRDIGASGAYYIASATETIYANRASLVGSIGVVSGGFGFKGLIEKLGIERRLYTAGEHKNFLDPFVDERADERKAWQAVLGEIHQQFLERVKKNRGQIISDERAYSGLLWSGEQAQKIGLIDHVGDINAVLDALDISVVVDFTVTKPYFDVFVDRFSTGVIRVLQNTYFQSLLSARQ